MSAIVSHIRSYVRRESRFTPAQRRAWDRYLPRYSFATQQLADAARFFTRNTPLTLEIGFGNGKSLLTLAQMYPNASFVGIEVYRPGIGRLLNDMVKHKVQNIRILYADAAVALAPPPACPVFDRVLILFPDPWPKQRHHKRRLLNPDFFNRLIPWMKPGALLHLATDWEHYGEQMRAMIANNEHLENLIAGNGFCPRPSWYPATAFEQRGQQTQRPIKNLMCQRV